MMISASPTGQIQAASAYMFRKLSAVNGRLRRWFSDETAARRSSFEPMEPRQLLSGIDDTAGDGEAGEYSITVADAPEIQVSGNGIVIHDRDPVTSTDNLTDFGTVHQFSDPVTHVFTLTNTGTEVLEIDNVLGGLSLVVAPDYPTSIQPGESGDLSVTMLTKDVGGVYSYVSIYSNSETESHFRLTLSGQVLGPDDLVVEQAQIRVSGNDNPIFNGDSETYPENLTDFGTIDQYSEPVVHYFNIDNPGNIPLEILDIDVPDGFTVDISDRTIEPGESGEFSIKMSSDNADFYFDDVVITSNAMNDEKFTFAISGDVLEIGRLQFNSSTPLADRTLIDDLGNTVVFKLAGPGFGTVLYDVDTNEIFSVELDSTKKSSGLTIDVSKTGGEGTGISSIDEVYIHGPLGYFKAGAVDLEGDFFAYSTLGSVVLNDINGFDQQYFFIGGATTSKTDLTFGQIYDLDLDISGHINKFTALEWTSTDDEADQLLAGSIGTFNITGRKASSGKEAVNGDLNVDIEIYNTGTQTGRPAVGTINVAGAVFESYWEINGYTNSVKLGSVDDLYTEFEDGLGTFTVVGEANELYILSGYFYDIGFDDDEEGEDCGCGPDGFIGSTVNTVNVGHWLGGELLADSIKAINITGTAKSSSEPARPGEVFDVLIEINALDVADNAFALNTLNITGFADMLLLLVDGNVNKITTVDILDSEFAIEGKLGSFVSSGWVEDVILEAVGGAGTIQAGQWDGGEILAETIKALTITGKSTGQDADLIEGNLGVELDVFGQFAPTNALSLGTVKVAGTIYSVVDSEHGSEYYEADWNIHGSVGSITADAMDGPTFDFTGYFGTGISTKVNSIKAGSVVDTHIHGESVSFGSINTVNWIDGGIEALKIGSLTTRGQAKTATTDPISGDFTGYLIAGDFFEPDTTSVGNVLNTMSIAGALSDNEAKFGGNVGTVTVGDMFFSTFAASGNIASFTSKSHIQDSMIASQKRLNNLRAVFIIESVITTSTIGTINVSKDFNAELFASNHGVSLSAVSIGSLTVGGSIFDSAISTKSNVNAVRAASFIDSALFLGVNTDVPMDQLPTSKLDFSNPAAVLGSFMITGAGSPANTPTFVHSRVAAGVLNNVNIKLVSNDESGEEHLDGFSAATRIGNYRRLTMVDSKAVPVVVTNKTTPGTYDTNGINYVLVVADLLDESEG